MMNIAHKIQKIQDNNELIQLLFPLLKTITFSNTIFPLTTLEINVPNVNSLYQGFSGTNLQRIVFNGQGNGNTINFYACMNGANSLKSVSFKNFKDNIIKSNNFNLAFSAPALETIDGASFDLSSYSMTSVGNSPFGTSLREIRFVENTLKNSIAFNRCKQLSNATIESIIDALQEVANSPTVTFSSQLSNLTDDQISTMERKGWTVVIS